MTNPVPVPAFGTPPTAPDPNNRPTYNADRAAMNFWMLGLNSTAGSNMVGLAQSASTNATSASESAIAAAAAAAGSNVELWDAVTVYAIGVVVISPAALAAGAASVTYVCKVATGTTHIDPYSDSTRWSIFSIPVPYPSGGAAYTASTALTSVSPFAIQISGDAGAWLKLPDATMLSKGIRHAVRNVGDNDVVLLDYTGARIGFIRPQSGTSISLSDNSTSAGKWVGDWELYGVTIDYALPITTLQSMYFYACSVKLTATKTLVVFGRTDLYLYFFVHDSSRIKPNGLIALLSNSATLVTVDVISIGNGDYALATLAYSSGFRTILINTNTLATNYLDSTAASSITSFGRLIATSAGAAYSYLSTNTGVIRAITVSGTTINIGPEVTMTAAEAPRLYSVGTSLVAVRHNNAQGITATPYSISGTTLTAGTASTIGCDPFAANTIRSDKLSNNDILVCCSYSNAFMSHLFRLSGTVISKFTVANMTWTGIHRTFDRFSHFDAGNGKLAIAVVSETVGLSVILVNYSAATPTSSLMGCTIAGGVVYEAGGGFVVGNNSGQNYCVLDLSGAYPAIKSIKVLPLSMVTEPSLATFPKMDSLSASSNNLRSGGLVSFIMRGDSSGYNLGSLLFTPASIIEKGSNVNPMMPFIPNFKSGSRKDSIHLLIFYDTSIIRQISIID